VNARISRYALPVLLAASAACGGGRQPPPDPPKKEQLRPPAALRYDFMWRQRVTAIWPDGQQSFEAVLQKRDGELSMLGMSALGLPGFILTLHADGALDVQNRSGQRLPFEPSYIVADIERVFFPWLEPVTPGFSGQQEGELAGQIVREHYANGRLLWREFRRSSNKDAGKVRVDYRFAQQGDAPIRVVLENGYYRYRLEIETLEQTRL
jgi:hypothetical protein